MLQSVSFPVAGTEVLAILHVPATEAVGAMAMLADRGMQYEHPDVLLAANAMQPAITGPDQSIPGAAVIIVTIFGVNRAVAIARRRIPIVKRALEPPATVIGKSGKWIQEALDREGLDDDDLEAALREHGLSSVDDMRLAVLEPDGSISIVPFDGPSVRMRTRRRRYRHQPQR